MAQDVTRQIVNAHRDYGRTKLQAIGRADLIGEFQTPINNDDQLQTAIDNLAGVLADLESQHLPEHQAFWQQAVDTVKADIAAELALAGLNGGDAFADGDNRGKVYMKRLNGIIEYAVARDLYEQSQA